MKFFALFFAIVLTSLTPGELKAETFSSGTQKVTLLELYTSEGCSSCPPADRWLSKLKDHKDLFKDFVPVAFHVDYWNYLGWRDEFSEPEHSNRQRRYHQVGRTGSVYTPGFVIDGKEWRGFFSPKNREYPPLMSHATDQVGDLTLTAKEDQYIVQFENLNQQSGLNVHLAYLGTDLHNNVRRGENAGRQLRHDFVVLAHISGALKKDGTATLPRAAIKNASAVAAWVSERRDPAPIQAVGGWLAVH